MLGQSYLMMGEFKNAANRYTEAAKRLKKPEKKKDAAYAAILSWDKLRKEKSSKTKAQSVSNRSLTESEKGFINAVKSFREISPDDKSWVNGRYHLYLKRRMQD